jgi:threonyl-tRNA synthetase
MSNDLKDHRQIGAELDLFTSSELVGSGLPLFTPKGTLLRRIIENYMFNLLEENGYDHVWSPHIGRKELYETSGHLEKFKEDMFPVMEAKGRDYVLKAMNCPHHIQIFARKPISYKEMPQRYAETSTVYRSEQSGELGGLTRVLSISIDDAHIFCRHDQVKSEFEKALNINKVMLKDFGFKEYWIRLSLRDPKDQKKYLGDDAVWEEMQKDMKDILKETNTPFKDEEGEAAFYGPKMDLMAVDAHGREWQLSTIQLDFNLPKRFDLAFVGEDGKKHKPYMIHRASLGSVERFLGVFLEHVQGILPVWLSPYQVTIIPITDKNNDYAQNIAKTLKKEDIRVTVDTRGETMQSKIRDAQSQKVPYMIILGGREEEAKKISVRTRGGENLTNLDLEEFLANIKKDIEGKD